MIEQLKRWARELKMQLMTLWFCRADPRTPLVAKIVTASVVAYAFSPIDLIPDFIPVLGYLDDLLLVPAGIYLAIRLIPAPVLADARVKADAWIAQRKAKPRNYLAAGMVVALWIALACACWFFIFGPPAVMR